MADLEVTRWRIELHLDGLPTDEQQFAMVANEGTSVTGDHDAGLGVMIHMANANLPTVPLMNAVTILAACAPNLNINAVQATRALSEKEAAAWIKKQFMSMKVSWKSSQDF